MKNEEFPPYEASCNELRTCNPLKTEYNDYVDLLNWIENRTSRYQTRTIKATTYWVGEISIPATNMEAGQNEFNPRLFALVYQ